MTRQQEGDDPRCECNHPLSAHPRVNNGRACTLCSCWHWGTHPDDVREADNAVTSKLPATVQPEETTLPAMDSYRFKISEEATTLPMPLQLLRLEGINEQLCRSFNTLLISNSRLEAERNALKAEVEKLFDKVKNAEAHELMALGNTEKARLELDAVVGQETPQDAFERGFNDCREKCTDLADYSMDFLIARIEKLPVPPYTPPLKAGQ